MCLSFGGGGGGGVCVCVCTCNYCAYVDYCSAAIFIYVGLEVKELSKTNKKKSK